MSRNDIVNAVTNETRDRHEWIGKAPRRAKPPRDAQCRLRSPEDTPLLDQHHTVTRRRLALHTAQQTPRRVRLQRGESELRIPIPGDDKIDESVAEIADAVEENDRGNLVSW